MAYKVPFVDLPKHYQNLKKEITPVIEDVLFKRADLIMQKEGKTSLFYIAEAKEFFRQILNERKSQ